MTVAVSIRSGSFVADGLATPRTLAFRLFDNADLIVKAGGVVQTLNVHYQLTGAYPTQQMIPITPFWANGVAVRYKRKTPARQLYDMLAGVPMQAETLEAELDRNALVALDLTGAQSDLEARALLVPDGETASTLPAKNQRANKILGFDVNGNPALVTGIRTDTSVIDDGVWLSTDALVDDGLWTAPFPDITDDGAYT